MRVTSPYCTFRASATEGEKLIKMPGTSFPSKTIARTLISFSRFTISIKLYFGKRELLTNIPSSLKSVAVPAIPFPSQTPQTLKIEMIKLIRINIYFFI